MTLVPPTSRGLTSGTNVTPVNSLVGGLAGQVLGGVGPSYAYPPGYELDYVQITANVNVASTTEASGTTIITSSAITFDGAPVLCHFYSVAVASSSVSGENVILSLFEGATQIGRLAFVKTVANVQIVESVSAFHRFTPTAGAHTYTITAFATSTTGVPNVGAGAGGTGARLPAFLRFVKV